MNRILKYASFLIFVIYLGQIIEKAIPHSHHEKDGLITLDFSGENDHSENEDETSDKIHTFFYQLNLVDIPTTCHISIQLFSQENTRLESITTLTTNNYNILPKILNRILFIIHTYSAKAPPFLIKHLIYCFQ